MFVDGAFSPPCPKTRVSSHMIAETYQATIKISVASHAPHHESRTPISAEPKVSGGTALNTVRPACHPRTNGKQNTNAIGPAAAGNHRRIIADNGSRRANVSPRTAAPTA